jgi:uncharacterized protein (TIGR04255 family)
MTEAPYPNAPVQEVVFEIRFPGEPAVECRRDEFFEQVRAEFPEIHVPKLQPTEQQAVALMPYHFKSEDHSKSILTALNLFAFASRKYEGFQPFREDALRWMRLFAERFRIQSLTRTGLRYVNLIPLLPDAPAGELLKIGVALGDYKTESLNNLVLGFQVPRQAGILNMSLGPSATAGQPQLVLDFDYAKTEDLSFSHVDDYLQESHAETKRLFESLLTDSYRSYLKGEAVG